MSVETSAMRSAVRFSVAHLSPETPVGPASIAIVDPAAQAARGAVPVFVHPASSPSGSEISSTVLTQFMKFSTEAAAPVSPLSTGSSAGKGGPEFVQLTPIPKLNEPVSNGTVNADGRRTLDWADSSVHAATPRDQLGALAQRLRERVHRRNTATDVADTQDANRQAPETQNGTVSGDASRAPVEAGWRRIISPSRRKSTHGTPDEKVDSQHGNPATKNGDHGAEDPPSGDPTSRTDSGAVGKDVEKYTVKYKPPDVSGDFYEVLGVPKDADAKTIREAYHKLARKLNPLVNTEHPDPRATEFFQDVNAAYTTLNDPDQRKLYDYTTEPEPPSFWKFTKHGSPPGARTHPVFRTSSEGTVINPDNPTRFRGFFTGSRNDVDPETRKEQEEAAWDLHAEQQRILKEFADKDRAAKDQKGAKEKEKQARRDRIAASDLRLHERRVDMTGEHRQPKRTSRRHDDLKHGTTPRVHSKAALARSIPFGGGPSEYETTHDQVTHALAERAKLEKLIEDLSHGHFLGRRHQLKAARSDLRRVKENLRLYRKIRRSIAPARATMHRFGEGGRTLLDDVEVTVVAAAKALKK